MNYYAAPMEGLTDRVWRQAHQKWFGPAGNADRYYAPFLSPPENRVLIKKKMAELSPAANPGAPVIPQLLAKDGELAAWMIGELRGLGYTEVNLNLGCPSGTVTAKAKDLSLTSKNSKAVFNICGGDTYDTNFTYTAENRKIKITRYNASIGSTCIQGYKYGTAATPCIVWTEGDGTSAKDHDIDYIEIKERYNASGSSDYVNTVEAVARVVKGSTYNTAGGATVTFASDGTVTSSNYSGTLVGYRYMTLAEVTG